MEDLVKQIHALEDRIAELENYNNPFIGFRKKPIDKFAVANDIYCCDKPFPQISNQGCIRCIACKTRVVVMHYRLCPKCNEKQKCNELGSLDLVPGTSEVICQNKDCGTSSNVHDYIKVKKPIVITSDEHLNELKHDKTNIVYDVMTRN